MTFTLLNLTFSVLGDLWATKRRRAHTNIVFSQWFCCVFPIARDRRVQKGLPGRLFDSPKPIATKAEASDAREFFFLSIFISIGPGFAKRRVIPDYRSIDTLGRHHFFNRTANMYNLLTTDVKDLILSRAVDILWIPSARYAKCDTVIVVNAPRSSRNRRFFGRARKIGEKVSRWATDELNNASFCAVHGPTERMNKD